MIKRYNTISFVYGVPGIILQFVGSVGANITQGSLLALVCFFISLAGTVLLIIGLGYYARAKGHSGWWGMLGLLSCLGLIILAFLPDRVPND